MPAVRAALVRGLLALAGLVVASAAMAQTPVLMGRWGIRAAVAAIENKPIPEKLFTPTYVLTKDNADQVDIGAVRQPKGWRPPL